MKLQIVTDEGVVIDSIEKIEDYDLTKVVAAGDVVMDIIQIIELGRSIERKKAAEKKSEIEAFNFTAYYTDEKVAELRAAFERVCDPNNWKMPIGKWIKREDFEIIKEAIMFFTATEARIAEDHGDIVKICAPGYYEGPAN